MSNKLSPTFNPYYKTSTGGDYNAMHRSSLYQWGRASDGHQFNGVNAPYTFPNNYAYGYYTGTGNGPGNSDFHYAYYTVDWRSNRNDNLWQGVDGINNPCPEGFEVPSVKDFEIWARNAGVVASNLGFNIATSGSKLNLYGAQLRGASLINLPNTLRLWTSTPFLDTNNPQQIYSDTFHMVFDPDEAPDSNDILGNGNLFSPLPRAQGVSVRCIKTQKKVVYTIQEVTRAEMLANNNPEPLSEVFCTDCTFPCNYFYTNDRWISKCGTGEYVYGRNNKSVVYASVRAEDGRIWLQQNLGSEFSKLDNPNFNPESTNTNDINILGEYFQWGRPADGHQEMLWDKNSLIGIHTNVTINPVQSGVQQDHGYFVRVSPAETNWTVDPNASTHTWWEGVDAVNNPCPIGYRIPTITELDRWTKTARATDPSHAEYSLLAIPVSGKTDKDTAFISLLGVNTYIWSSTRSNASHPLVLRYVYGVLSTSDYEYPAYGLNVRCIKD